MTLGIAAPAWACCTLPVFVPSSSPAMVSDVDKSQDNSGVQLNDGIRRNFARSNNEPCSRTEEHLYTRVILDTAYLVTATISTE